MSPAVTVGGLDVPDSVRTVVNLDWFTILGFGGCRSKVDDDEEDGVGDGMEVFGDGTEGSGDNTAETGAGDGTDGIGDGTEKFGDGTFSSSMGWALAWLLLWVRSKEGTEGRVRDSLGKTYDGDSYSCACTCGIGQWWFAYGGLVVAWVCTASLAFSKKWKPTPDRKGPGAGNTRIRWELTILGMPEN